MIILFTTVALLACLITLIVASITKSTNDLKFLSIMGMVFVAGIGYGGLATGITVNEIETVYKTEHIHRNTTFIMGVCDSHYAVSTDVAIYTATNSAIRIVVTEHINSYGINSMDNKVELRVVNDND